MPERATVFEITQIGPEATPGTPVPATRKLLGTSIAPNIKSENKTYRAKGSRMTTTGVQNKEWAEASIDMEVAQYTDLSYILSGLLGPPSISVVSAGVYLHEWDPLNWTALTPKIFTVESGSYARALEMPYGLVTGFGMEFNRDGVSGSGDMLGQKITDGITLTVGTNEVQTQAKTGTVSSGTFTLSFMGETTAAIAFDATAGTIQTALLLLPNLASGDVVVTGGPAGTSNVIYTFGGQYASNNVPLIIADSALLVGGGTYDVVQTTPGAVLTELTQAPISGNHWDFYVDTSAAGWGGTKLTRCFKAAWDIGGMYGPVWVGNTAVAGWSAAVDMAPDTSFSFMVEADSTGMGFLTQLRSGDMIFPRIKATGPTLGASTYYAALDFAVELTDISDFSDEDGVYAVEYTGEIAYDRTSGKYLSFDVRNNIASIT